MRLDLETIKKIEFYLTDSMTPIEKKIFEQEMDSDAELKDAVDQQRELMLALEQTQLKQNAITAYKIYNRRRTYRLVAGILIASVALGGSIAGYAYLNSEPQAKNQVIPNNTAIVQNTATVTENPVYSYEEEKKEVEVPVERKRIEYNKGLGKGDFKVMDNDQELTVDTSHKWAYLPKNEDQEDKKVDSVKFGISRDAEFFEKVKKKAQVFEGKAEKDIYVTGAEGTMIKIPARSLVDEKQKPVKGDVKIELKEFYKKSDFILGNLHTMSNGQLLESGGMIHIEIKHNGNNVQLKEGKNIQILFIDKTDGDNMEIFTGKKIEEWVEWTPQTKQNAIDDSLKMIGDDRYSSKDYRLYGTYFHRYKTTYIGGGNGRWRDSIDVNKLQKFNRLQMQSSRLGWINCDRFSSGGERTNVSVMVDGPAFSEVRMVFKDINSVMGAYGEFEHTFRSVPVGRKVTIIAFGMNEKMEPYYASQDITIGDNDQIQLQLRPMSEEDLDRELKKLN